MEINKANKRGNTLTGGGFTHPLPTPNKIFLSRVQLGHSRKFREIWRSFPIPTGNAKAAVGSSGSEGKFSGHKIKIGDCVTVAPNLM